MVSSLRIVFLLLGLVTIMGSCSEPNRFLLNIDIQSSFEYDDMEIFIDGRRVLNENVNTSWNVGVCFINGKITQPKSLTEGNHIIKVILNKSHTKIDEFTLNDNLHVGIRFDPDTEELSIDFQHEPFFYD